MARHAQAQRALSRAFAQRQCEKHYQAIVQGHLGSPSDAWSLVDAPIAVDWPHRPLRIIAPQGQASQTRWRVLEHLVHNGEPCTRLALSPITGRTHQLRVHLQSMGHPIVGDALYGNAVDDGSARLLLHACALSLPHPRTLALTHWHSPVPF